MLVLHVRFLRRRGRVATLLTIVVVGLLLPFSHAADYDVTTILDNASGARQIERLVYRFRLRMSIPPISSGSPIQ
jgi:hypothetical protein